MAAHITQKFLANAAGVSQKTVSLFLKGDPHVAEGTKAKLQSLCKDYRYFPNLAAKSMKDRRFKRIACVLCGCEWSPHLSSYISGAAIELEPLGYSLVIEPMPLAQDGLSLKKEPNFFKSLSVDGVIGIPGRCVPQALDEVVSEMGVPCVWLNRRQAPGAVCVNFDEADATFELVRHFVAGGRRRFAWFGPPESGLDNPPHHSHRERVDFFESVLKASGLELCRKTLSAFNERIAPALPRLFDPAGGLPDALLCYNDAFAKSAARAAYEFGVPPGSLEIAWYASSSEPSDYYDAGTMIVLPEPETARQGARCVVAMIEGRGFAELLPPLKAKLRVAASFKDDCARRECR